MCYHSVCDDVVVTRVLHCVANCCVLGCHVMCVVWGVGCKRVFVVVEKVCHGLCVVL